LGVLGRINKRSYETMQDAKFAKYGMAVGVIERIEGMGQMRCGLVISEWPSWVFAIRERGWEAAVVITKTKAWHPLIRKTCPGVEVVLYDQCEDRLGAAANIQVWVSDIDPPRRLRLFESEAVRAVLTTRKVRRGVSLGEMWEHRALKVSHAGSGGMTDGSWVLHAYCQKGMWSQGELKELPGRDMLCVIDPKVQGMPCPAPPKISKVTHAQVRMVRPGLVRVDGLCPWGSDRIRVVAPCVYSPTKWVRQQLTGFEACSLRDVRQEVLDCLSPKEISQICKSDRLVPEQVCIALLNSMELVKREAQGSIMLTGNQKRYKGKREHYHCVGGDGWK
jgi:hypothetical protein